MLNSLKFPSQNTVRSCSVGETGTNSRWIPPRISYLRGGSSNIKYLSTRLSLSNENGGSTMNSQGVGGKDAVIIVDHGSRRKESNLMLDEFVAMFRDKTGYPIVEPAHMELAEPSIKDAFGLCVEKGANRVIISPFFLFPGRHWHQDIPALSAEAAKGHPGVPYVITSPLGLHELLVDVVNDRIKHCLSHVAGDADECAACVGTTISVLNEKLRDIWKKSIYTSCPHQYAVVQQMM
ncbi:sirohydrochlorin ferrochelatase, chloroplastic-like isoform X2 [Euphorbia lathyris]|uniref:sirohydrochlorin ferrochelatase, chloroplastic-like isoform X2 n=1 Tax=Euphorbia lathyris TaxID=212925 RepID=UPI003313E36F